jgi:hypothetical protein
VFSDNHQLTTDTGASTTFRSRARDQQKWTPVLRPISRQPIEKAHDLFAKPLTLWRIMRL